MRHMQSTKDKFEPAEIKDLLNTSIIGRDIIYYEKIDSTNKTAINIANNGAVEGTVILTDEQTKGRGRLNRSWISEPYANITMSLIIRLSLSVDKSFYLTMIASIALVKAIKKITCLKTLIKWPNDIYYNNKKLSGILTELKFDQSL